MKPNLKKSLEEKRTFCIHIKNNKECILEIQNTFFTDRIFDFDDTKYILFHTNANGEHIPTTVPANPCWDEYAPCNDTFIEFKFVEQFKMPANEIVNMSETAFPSLPETHETSVTIEELLENLVSPTKYWYVKKDLDGLNQIIQIELGSVVEIKNIKGIIFVEGDRLDRMFKTLPAATEAAPKIWEKDEMAFKENQKEK